MATVAALIEPHFTASGAVDAAAQKMPCPFGMTGLVTVAAFQILDVLEAAAEYDQPGIKPDGKAKVFHFHTATAI